MQLRLGSREQIDKKKKKSAIVTKLPNHFFSHVGETQKGEDVNKNVIVFLDTMTFSTSDPRPG